MNGISFGAKGAGNLTQVVHVNLGKVEDKRLYHTVNKLGERLQKHATSASVDIVPGHDSDRAVFRVSGLSNAANTIANLFRQTGQFAAKVIPGRDGRPPIVQAEARRSLSDLFA